MTRNRLRIETPISQLIIEPHHQHHPCPAIGHHHGSDLPRFSKGDKLPRNRTRLPPPEGQGPAEVHGRPDFSGRRILLERKS
jgi:hypothetical protein